MPIWQNINDAPIFPGLATIATERTASSRVAFRFFPMHSGVVVERSVGQFHDTGFTRALLWERFTGVPGLSTIITEDGIGVMIGPFFVAITSRIPSRRTYESSRMLTELQGRSMVIHMHGRNMPQ